MPALESATTASGTRLSDESSSVPLSAQGSGGIPEAVLVGATTAVSAEAGNVRLRDVRTGRPLRVAAHPSPVTSLVSYTGPDGRPRIASGDAEGTLRIWDPAPPDGTRIGSVSTRGFNDHVADTDLLNRTALAYALNQVLEPGDGPTVITIEGACCRCWHS